MSVVEDVLTYLRSLSLEVYDGDIPRTPGLPYVIVYSDDGHPDSASLCGTADSNDHKVRVTTVGVNTAQCRAARLRVKSLDGQLVGGAFVRHEYGNPIVPENELPSSVMSAYDQFNVPVTL